ncbi:hypothetical protein F441_03382 [Phytophthora nicotianae CJ01A1]|uniref:Uncharacterized protein n=4 Tax=Phytophthora nicotianae TaxID=4792 RepID=W2ZZ27_PHYNI|nr:hypothetical protein L917_03160 [Phytophthora nicotianae]ETM53346.1 hypothetical protein L914_03161 [Phytophthora nicotianae]ETO82392.1 hypothetical protein F444_03467 [Phytophthora nicotianae P1976]ETP23512.1 hypothetical protein F441_03382 [Phytophthora nicotianae CJ01A1]ETP51519.1 hypothetical protein F442_03369 [Phytophthora nicotianae P10297]
MFFNRLNGSDTDVEMLKALAQTFPEVVYLRSVWDGLIDHWVVLVTNGVGAEVTLLDSVEPPVTPELLSTLTR